jgi:trans-aconitate 2-methyltransferase
MIATASAEIDTGAEPSGSLARLSYVCADLRDWRPQRAPDVVVANAVLQWVPDHLDLIEQVAGWLAPGGTFAFQVPANFDSPSHTSISDLRTSPRWRERLGDGADRQAAVESPEVYLAALDACGLEPDVWQTTYLHVLPGEDPVLDWVKGTALRPVLTALADDAAATEEFLAECGVLLREAYPAGPAGTLFPFKRTFAIGRARTAA